MDNMLSFGLDKIGFVLAAVAYLFFFGLLLTTKVTNLPKYLLLALSFTSFCWAVFYSWSSALPFTSLSSHVIEITKNGMLLLFLFAALSQASNTLSQFIRQPHVYGLLICLISWGVISSSSLLSASNMFTGNLAICILQLALLEALYRRSGEAKWQYKPLVLALTITTLYDFALLAESALFGRIDDQIWFARGFVYSAMLPLMIIAVRRIKAWGINVYISRDIVLQSSLVLGAGVYLCLLAITGFYIRYFGGNWSNLIQATFIILGIAILIFLILSGTLRRKLKVFIEKHFFANKFDYREKWLRLTRSLQKIDITGPEDHYKSLLQAWLNSISYSRGAIIRFKGNDIVTLALQQRHELNSDEQQLIAAYQQFFSSRNWLVDLTDNTDPFVRSVIADKVLDIQLIIPIHTKGALWGVCVMNAPAVNKLRLNWELRDFLSLVSEQISSQLLLMQASQTLSENAQFIAFSRMSAFVVHDLKNVKAQIDLILKNATKHRNNPEFIDDSFSTLAAMQQRLQNMLSQLTNKRADQQTDSLVSVGRLVQDVIDNRCAVKKPVPSLVIEQDCTVFIDKDRFGSVLYHLIDNAQHATEADGAVAVTVTESQGQLQLRITDTGCGMTESFIQNRLFKAFDSTKGNAGMGIGAHDALHFVEQQGGQLSVNSVPGQGTTFTLLLPLKSAVSLAAQQEKVIQGT
ncbi:MAG: PEP-CTERM system histidine kinase PrsK [Rheinheimera sp.]|uniref:XrtA/PEP-CTERM system histidine kinase PrsK n=1 Tax=Arsukibacterium sp. UBA3155 TaxID=1946058 RepID=UPI000C90D6F9|nr:XrtA/PEP-CTERM system histidine kinase PrsK [Arsukibacterium sp. UBA3155]MAD74830.1 PEP-CTERM system histidine kinase PrsK [Rheinheimera sp.]|tara:strand:+ start:64100 stop:66172 length:2073 start_codon:yes stop_codon:yes gene_type:complete